MSPEDVNAGLVERMVAELSRVGIDYDRECVRHALAAVLPEIREEAERVLLHEMQNEVKTWHVYESRDTGDVFPSDSVVDLIQDRIDSLSTTTEEPADA